MKLPLAIKLTPSCAQHAALVAALERFNAACNAIAAVAFREHLANKIALQKIVYYDVRERFGLSSQMTVRAIGKVVEAYKRDKTIQPTFRPHGALTYDERIMSWKGMEHVSLLALDGRHLVACASVRISKRAASMCAVRQTSSCEMACSTCTPRSRWPMLRRLTWRTFSVLTWASSTSP